MSSLIANNITNNLANNAPASLAAVLETSQKFAVLMNQYNCAIMEVETKLKVLDSEFSLKFDRNPIESITSRLKDPLSIINKLKRKGLPISVESLENNLFDIAGLRVVCDFQDDIYILEQLLTQQDDIEVIMRKDYIANPKPNGYRSLHLIIATPVFLTTGKKMMNGEVQFRTIAMDFWASVEHKLKYKKNISAEEAISQKLKKCADDLALIDNQMQDIRIEIDSNEKENPNVYSFFDKL